jgi:protein-disulfide isomerase
VQGRFWQYQNAVFSNAPKRGHLGIDRAKRIEFAGQAGVPDLAAFERALDDPVHLAAVQIDATEAQRIGATSTPIFMIGTTPAIGAQPLEVFRWVIDDEIALAERK